MMVDFKRKAGCRDRDVNVMTGKMEKDEDDEKGGREEMTAGRENSRSKIGCAG